MVSKAQTLIFGEAQKSIFGATQTSIFGGAQNQFFFFFFFIFFFCAAEISFQKYYSQAWRNRLRESPWSILV